MAKHSFGVKDAVGEVKEGGGGSVAPPPAGAYRGTVTQMKLEENRNHEPMLTVVTELKMPPKLKKHDGYWLWVRFNLTDQGAPFLNGFLNAIAGDEKKGLMLQKELWEKGTLTTKDEDGGDVTKIGPFLVGSPEGKKPIAVAVVERAYVNKDGDTVDTLDATRWMPASATLAQNEDTDADADNLGGDADDLDGADDSDALDELGEGDDLDGDSDDLDGEGDAEGDSSDDADPEADEFSAELDAITDLKALRLKARDEFEIAPATTKGKTEDEVRDMIFDAWDAKRGEAGEDELGDDLDDDLDEKPAPAARRGTKKKAGEEPPF